MKMNEFAPLMRESNEEYIERILIEKRSKRIRLTWEQVAEMIHSYTGIQRSPDTWRKNAASLVVSPAPDAEEEESAEETLVNLIREYRKERYKLADINTQNNAILRRMAREESIKEIALEVANTISSKKILPYCKAQPAGDGEAIVMISDWHYGMTADNHWNYFDIEECINRVADLREQVREYCSGRGVKKLHVVNLGDMIAGRIHSTIRYQSRVDVIRQVMEVSEIKAEMLCYWHNEGFDVEYYDCLDNHSRLEPDKKESLDLESLALLIPWYLKARLSDYDININSNEYDPEIISFTACNGKYNIGGAHGHKDSPKAIASRLAMLTKKNHDMVLTAHLHHFAADEQNEVIVVSNGSLMGTDDHAKGGRYTSKASQNVIIVNERSVCDDIHRIVLN